MLECRSCSTEYLNTIANTCSINFNVLCGFCFQSGLFQRMLSIEIFYVYKIIDFYIATAVFFVCDIDELNWKVGYRVMMV